MSRNKDIKLLHDITGWSYKLCRKKMKENHWDWVKALGYDEVIDLITNQIPPVLESCYEVIVNMCELITNTAKNLKENLKSIDMNQLIQYMQKEDVE